MKIKICKNFPKLKKLENKLAIAFPNDTIIIKKCLNACSHCKNYPVAKIKNKKLKSKRISSLIIKIKDEVS